MPSRPMVGTVLMLSRLRVGGVTFTSSKQRAHAAPGGAGVRQRGATMVLALLSKHSTCAALTPSRPRVGGEVLMSSRQSAGATLTLLRPWVGSEALTSSKWRAGTAVSRLRAGARVVARPRGGPAALALSKQS